MCSQYNLSKKQQKFVAEYAVGGDAQAAALAAGYAQSTAKAAHKRLLERPEIAQAVEMAKGDLQAADVVTPQWVVARLKEVADRCMQAEAAQSGKDAGLYKFDAGGAIRSLNLLGKHLNMFTERQANEQGVHETALEELQ